MKKLFLPVLLVILILGLFFCTGNGYTADIKQEPTAVEQPDQKVPPAPQTKKIPTFLAGWLHMLDKNESKNVADSGIIAFGSQVPADISKTLASTGGEKGGLGFFTVLLRSIIAICVGFLGVFIVRRLNNKRIYQLEKFTPPNNDQVSLLWVNILRNIPALVSTLLMTIVSIIVFLLISGGVAAGGRMLFQAILGVIIIFAISSIFSRIIFSPKDTSIRFLKISDSLVKPIHFAVFLSFAVLFSGILTVRLIKELGAQPQTISWLIILFGTLVIAFYAYITTRLRRTLSNIQESSENQDGKSWISNQIFKFWHIPVLLYLFLVWFIWIGQELTGTKVHNGAFILSMLIIPIYLVLSHSGKVLLVSVIESLGLGSRVKIDPISKMEIVEDEAVIIARKQNIINRSYLIFRIFLFISLTSWVLSLWGYQLPYAANTIRTLFESLVTVALALFCWKFASRYIQQKIEEAAPEPPEEQQESDDEFGGAAPRGRAHTLLPMLRKAVGTVLIAMVVLTIVSSLGINIGPLLAGAGVVGLAIGFGAQKLVSDILSGFFFLLDDAFRVGEYIQAGKIRGTVEAITLRNVMLRHHLGMLQVIPHSDLGTVTNYMRGGMIIKFPLEFPYDTDIDKVRKIIKKVGVGMLEDEELGEDFLQPLKSQGVYQITNSIMVIRVKFTAKPGKQFVIKREAFRRITEALNAKGIYYAHRKVIVDFPEEQQKNIADEQTKQKAIQAGAAAAAMIEEEQQQEQLKKQQESES